MSALTLTLKSPPTLRVDASGLAPERLYGLKSGEVARLKLGLGNEAVPVGDLFAVTGDDAADIRFRGATDKFDFLGREMRRGRLSLEGDAGAYLGRAMSGGEIALSGHAGPWAATALGGGRISITGDAGEGLGGALPEDRYGMNGGIVIVGGRAGNRAGDRMRRGIIAIAGNAGDYAGSRMIAGTLVVMGAVLGQGAGAFPGFGMKRGTLLFRHPPARMLPTFRDGGRHELGFLALLRRTLEEAGAPSALTRDMAVPARRFTGDAAFDGRGEILVLG